MLGLPAEIPSGTPRIQVRGQISVQLHLLHLWLVSRSAAPSTFIFKDLATATHAFLRHSALRRALQAPFVGPYTVLHRGRQDLHHRGPECSIGRLKPAYVLCWHRTRFTTGHSFQPHDSLWTAGTLSRLPGGAAVSAGVGVGAPRG